jgi:hypothetical protein
VVCTAISACLFGLASAFSARNIKSKK